MEILPYIPLNSIQEAEQLISDIQKVFPEYTSDISVHTGAYVILSPKMIDPLWRSKMPKGMIIPSDMTIVTLEEE